MTSVAAELFHREQDRAERRCEPDEDGDCKRCGLPFENPAEITHECPPGFTDSPRRHP